MFLKRIQLGLIHLAVAMTLVPINSTLNRVMIVEMGMAAWLVLDHEGCTFVERREDLFAEPTSSLPGADEISGRRDLRALVGVVFGEKNNKRSTRATRARRPLSRGPWVYTSF